MILNLTIFSIIIILEIMIVKHPSISVKQTVAESNISEVFLLPRRLSATVLRIKSDEGRSYIIDMEYLDMKVNLQDK